MKPVCVCERERWREGEGERGVLYCINTNRKSLLKHVSTPASYTTTQSYDCHVEWIKLTCLYLQWFWSEWVGTEWHNVLHYSTLRFMFQNHGEQKYYIPRTQRAVTDQMVPRSASWDRKEISRDTGRDDWRVTPSSDYKPQGVVCWTGAPIPKALYHTLCWLYCQWYTHNYMLASSEPKTIIALALTLKWPIHTNAGHKNCVKIHGISLAKLQQLLSGLFK